MANYKINYLNDRIAIDYTGYWASSLGFGAEIIFHADDLFFHPVVSINFMFYHVLIQVFIEHGMTN
jgi:hypothetical protein